MTRSPQHIAALEYALQRGWYVFPVTPGGKIPLPGTRGHLDATTDKQQIDTWWGSNPNFNVGIAVAPSHLVVLDIDVGKKKDGTSKRGRESLEEIEGELGPTLLAMTGRGGTHAVYERPKDLPAQRIIGFKDGLDLIGEGYIVAAPSYLAETKRYYQWTQLHPIAPLPALLQKVTREPRAREKVQTIGTPISEGSRNASLFKLGCALRDTGIGAEALARALDAENKERNKPPLPDAELALIVNSVLQRVQVTRDVALGAIVEQEIQAIFAPPSRSDWLENVARTPQPPVIFYSTGFADLDKLLNGGFATRQLVGLIAPPSAGKSALLGHWLLTLAKHRPVLHCSLELTRHELVVRYAAHELELPWVDGIKGGYSQDEMIEAVRGIRVKIFGAEDLDPVDPFGSIYAEAEKMRQECGISPIVAIDYIQLMARGASSETRHRVGELTMRARKMSQALDTVVLGVFTTMRASYGNKKSEEQMRIAGDPTAYLSAAKESGDIEFDCATLMYLDVDKLAPGVTKPGRIAVARVRVGEIGFVGVRAKLDEGRFWNDPSALGDFEAETRRAKAEADTLGNDCRRLLETVAKMPNRAIGDLQTASKLSGSKWKAALEKLLDDGSIKKDELRSNGRPVPNARTLVLKNTLTAPSVPEEGQP